MTSTQHWLACICLTHFVLHVFHKNSLWFGVPEITPLLFIISILGKYITLIMIKLEYMYILQQCAVFYVYECMVLSYQLTSFLFLLLLLCSFHVSFFKTLLKNTCKIKMQEHQKASGLIWVISFLFHPGGSASSTRNSSIKSNIIIMYCKILETLKTFMELFRDCFTYLCIIQIKYSVHLCLQVHVMGRGTHC